MRLRLLAVLAFAACGSPCRTDLAGGTFCVPDGGVVPAGQALALELRTMQCANTCRVAVDAGVVSLTSETLVCPPGPGPQPGAACRQIVTCTVPPLTEGDWTVVSTGAQTSTLRVTDAGLSSCTMF